MATPDVDCLAPAASRRRGFTLVELLVVIGIIALLISILLPTLNSARHSAQSTVNLSNLRQIGVGLEYYRNDNNGKFPRHSSLGSEVPRKRWADEIHNYFEQIDVFVSPLLDDRARSTQMVKWAHTLDQTTGAVTPDTKYWGGYGYNFQYLGNSRIKAPVTMPYYAGTADIDAPAETIAIADTRGSRNGDATFDYDQGAYVIDPPLQSFDYGSKGSRKTTGDPNDAGNHGYSGGGTGTRGEVVNDHRSWPMPRNSDGRVAMIFVDGHGELRTPDEMDDVTIDASGNRIPTNRYYNGLGDPGKM